MPVAWVLFIAGLVLVFATHLVTLGWILVSIGGVLIVLSFIYTLVVARQVRKAFKTFGGFGNFGNWF